MSVELALNDLALFALVHELDRIFQADDVHLTRLVQVIDHRGERRRLAGSGGAGDEDHALMVVAELLDDRRQAEAIDRRHSEGNGAEGRADAGLFAKDVDAKAAAVGGDIGEVDVVALAQLSWWPRLMISAM